jgi:hypothetical protein
MRPKSWSDVVVNTWTVVAAAGWRGCCAGSPPATCWHRGLLALRVPRRYDPAVIEEPASWVDTLLFRLTGRDSLRRACELLGRSGVNHAGLDLRNVLREQALLAELARVPEMPDLRSLTIDWPLGMLVPAEGGAMPVVSGAFLAGLLALPLSRRLTHLASSWPFDGEQAEVVRQAGVSPAHARHALWMHEVAPQEFRATRGEPQAAPDTLPGGEKQ